MLQWCGVPAPCHTKVGEAKTIVKKLANNIFKIIKWEVFTCMITSVPRWNYNL